MKHSPLAIGILLAALGFSGQAAALQQFRFDLQTAVNNCQGALPGFEGAFRKRPLGIANEGGSTAFISCALSAQVVGSTGVNSLDVGFINRGAATVDVACTLTDGFAAPFGAPLFFPKTITVPAGAAIVLGWRTSDNGGNNFRFPSLSCAIPSHVEINLTGIQYDSDVGA